MLPWWRSCRASTWFPLWPGSARRSDLRRHRLAAGLSQEALAERARSSARTISDLERGVHRAPYVDSSGFSTCRFERWYDAKYGRTISERRWVKCHLMTGITTNIVTSVEITPGTANDCPHLPALAHTTARRFDVEEVSADKGYISHRNLAAVVGLGATAYIPFKVNTTGGGPELWRRLYHYYQFNREAFLAYYHKRSNVETTFSMVKGKFGDALRSKSDTTQVNEVLCKVLCHNLCVLVQSIYELGIGPAFWTEAVAV